MNILSKFKTLLFLLPILEIIGFIMVGSLIGVIPTLLLIIASMLLGGAILRNHGYAQLQRFQQRMMQGVHSTIPVYEHMMVLLAGLLLIIPGFITSVIGLLLLLSAVRLRILKYLIAKGYIVTASETKTDTSDQRIIEGEFWRNDDNQKH